VWHTQVLSVIHGKAIRKRTYASSRSVQLHFVVDDEHSDFFGHFAAALKMNGFSVTFVTCR
jgi:MFS-type transporter involved in bile tolerance (Atg22 family)